jgi:hypothetical protein
VEVERRRFYVDAGGRHVSLSSLPAYRATWRNGSMLRGE